MPAFPAERVPPRLQRRPEKFCGWTRFGATCQRIGSSGSGPASFVC